MLNLHVELMSHETFLSLYFLFQTKNTQMLKCVNKSVHSKQCFYNVCKNDVGEVPPENVQRNWKKGSFLCN